MKLYGAEGLGVAGHTASMHCKAAHLPLCLTDCLLSLSTPIASHSHAVTHVAECRPPVACPFRCCREEASFRGAARCPPTDCPMPRTPSPFVLCLVTEWRQASGSHIPLTLFPIGRPRRRCCFVLWNCRRQYANLLLPCSLLTCRGEAGFRSTHATHPLLPCSLRCCRGGAGFRFTHATHPLLPCSLPCCRGEAGFRGAAMAAAACGRWCCCWWRSCLRCCLSRCVNKFEGGEVWGR